MYKNLVIVIISLSTPNFHFVVLTSFLIFYNLVQQLDTSEVLLAFLCVLIIKLVS